jgi:hypothetical protein
MKEVVTFLNFDGNCREAMQFYKKCFGAELFLLPYGDAPGDPAWKAAGREGQGTCTPGLPKGSTDDSDGCRRHARRRRPPV